MRYQTAPRPVARLILGNASPGRQRGITVVEGGEEMLLVLGVILLIIAIAGGAIVHPVLFAIGIIALVLFFMGSGRRAAV